MCETLADIDEQSAIGQLRRTICESVDGVLLALVDAAESGDPTDQAFAKRLTGDRGEMMRSLRTRFLQLDPPLQKFAGVPALLDGLPFAAFVGDKAFDADWLLDDLEGRGAEAVIPPRRNRTEPREHDRDMYGWRHLVENFFAKIKELRAIATRYGQGRTRVSRREFTSSPAWWRQNDCQQALNVSNVEY